MSESESEPEKGIGDDQLPDDLVPGEDNPLAEGLEDGESVEGLLTGGRGVDEDDQEESGEPAEDPDADQED